MSITTMESSTIQAIPENQRHGNARDLFTIWFGSNIMLLTMFTGSLAVTVFNLSFFSALMALVLGNLVGAIFVALHSAQGPQLAVPQMIQTRGQFGFYGALLVVGVVVIMYLGFYASNLVVGGEALHTIYQPISKVQGITIIAIGSLIAVIFGYKLIHKYTQILAVLSGLMLLAAFIRVFSSQYFPQDFFQLGTFSSIGFMGTLSIAALWQLAYAPYVSDYSRYLPKATGAKTAFWASYWGCSLGSLISMILGLTVARAYSGDFIQGLIHLTGSGLFSTALIIVFSLGIAATNSMNLYCGTLSSITILQTIFHRWSPRVLARTIVALSLFSVAMFLSVSSSDSFVESYVNFILLLMCVLIPWTAINLIDYYFIHHTEYDVPSFFKPDGGIYGYFNWPALICYVIGILIQIPFLSTPLYVGPLAKLLGEVDISWAVGLLVVSPLYYVVAMLYKRTLPEIDNQQLQQHSYDYVIVGAGSAGSVIANRLSEDPNTRVCLIEAGAADNSPRIQIPAGTITLYKSKKYSWNFFSTPQKRLNNRQIHAPRGKMVGGSSSMNSMIYIRGNASDYDNWEAKGCAGWGWKEVLPFFKRSEKNVIQQDLAFHGVEGELFVDHPKDPNPLSKLFIQAAALLNLKENQDFNAASSEGVGIYDVTQRDGQRLSSFKAFVQPILTRSNLTVVTECEVERIHHSEGQVHSIHVQRQGQNFDIRINKELILSAGAFVSPLLLMKSGIGPKSELEQAGIECKVDLPGVGKNLQEHIDGLVTVRTNSSKTLGFSVGALASILPAPFQYALKRKGWLTTNYVEAGGFAKTPLATDLPDVQFHFVPGYRSHRGRLFEWGHGYAIHTCVLRPKSIGEIRVNAQKQIEIDYNFLEKEHDMHVLIEGIKLAQRILKQDVFKAFNGQEILPGPDVKTDADYQAYVREYAATVFHPVGTCKMGIDAMSVVDPKLKVVGFNNLRIADASIMPDLVSGNTNAPCIMIGERAADFILQQQ